LLSRADAGSNAASWNADNIEFLILILITNTSSQIDRKSIPEVPLHDFNCKHLKGSEIYNCRYEENCSTLKKADKSMKMLIIQLINWKFKSKRKNAKFDIKIILIVTRKCSLFFTLVITFS
jgi:hypothetical protein